jgi:UDP-GlcNAc:undecaprenyl-phosphate GlcNAc-1-phosphate transferase
VWDADRGHIHHRLIDKGLNPRRVALLLYGVAALGAMLSVAQSLVQNSFGGVILVLFVGSAWIGVQHLGYVEFGVAGRMFVDGAFRRHLSAQLTLRAFEESLRKAETREECWTALMEAAREYGYDTLQARIGGRDFHMTLDWEEHEISRPVHGWSLQIPLSGSDYVMLERISRSEGQLARVGPFADMIQRTLEGREFGLEVFAKAEDEEERVRTAAAGKA